MQQIPIYFKTDFKVFIRTEAGFAVPFRFEFYTNMPSRPFVAKFDGHKYCNCELMSDGRLCVAFDDHGFGLGKLMVKQTYYLTDSDYKSEICDRVLAPEPVINIDQDLHKSEIILALQGDEHLEFTAELPAYYQQGLSNYDLAVKAGFKGTLEEWLEKGFSVDLVKEATEITSEYIKNVEETEQSVEEKIAEGIANIGTKTEEAKTDIDTKKEEALALIDEKSSDILNAAHQAATSETNAKQSEEAAASSASSASDSATASADSAQQASASADSASGSATSAEASSTASATSADRSEQALSDFRQALEEAAEAGTDPALAAEVAARKNADEEIKGSVTDLAQNIYDLYALYNQEEVVKSTSLQATTIELVNGKSYIVQISSDNEFEDVVVISNFNAPSYKLLKSFYPNEIRDNVEKEITADFTGYLNFRAYSANDVNKSLKIKLYEKDAEYNIAKNACLIKSVEKVAKDAFDKVTNIDKEWSVNDGGFVNYKNGTIGALGASCYTDYINVVEGESIELIGCGIDTSDSRGLAFYDANKNFVSGIQYNDSDGTDLLQIQVPHGVSFMRFSVKTSNKDTYKANINHQSVLGGLHEVIENVKIANGYKIYNSSNVSVTQGGVIMSTNGKLNTNLYTAHYSDYIEILPSQNIRLSKVSLAVSDGRGLAFYDINKNFISGIAFSSADDIVAIVPSNARYLRTTINSANRTIFSISLTSGYEFPENIVEKVLKQEKEVDAMLTNAEPLEYISDNTGMLDLFLNVGCIGDSLASGECCSRKDGVVSYHDIYKYSWGQFLARKTGNTYYNFSQGGLRTKTWLNSQYATQCFDGNHNCQAYIIGLGQNDKNNNVPIGTISDIDDYDYSLNPDTFIGNYGKIIQKIKEVVPKAKIFILTDYISVMETTGYNQAIRDIAEHFSNVYLLDLYRYGQATYKKISALVRQGHYSAYGYKLCAMTIASYINHIILSNPEEFAEIEFIDTDLSWE